MFATVRLLVVSDIHFAGDAEKARGHPRDGLTRHPLKLALMRTWDRLVWMPDPLAHNGLLDRFLSDAPSADVVVANGDFSVDSANIGMSDGAAYASAAECLEKLRGRFGAKLHATIGDHELGKKSLLGNRGGMSMASWPRTIDGLGLKPFWRLQIGRYVLIGVTSSLIGLPILRQDTLPGEYADWEKLRAEHLRQIDAVFAELKPDERVLLFCHDPSALPFLIESPNLSERIGQIERTVIGHLHSGFFLWHGRMLAGMPTIGFMGHTVRRLSTALNRARHWRRFNVILCPALAGIELTRSGGWLSAQLDPAAERPAEFKLHPLRR